MEKEVIAQLGIPNKGGKHALTYVKPNGEVQSLAKSFSEKDTTHFVKSLKSTMATEIENHEEFKRCMGAPADSFMEFRHMLHFPRQYCQWCNEKQACDKDKPCSETMRCKIHITPHSPCDTFPLYLQAVKRNDVHSLGAMVYSQFAIHGGWDNIIVGGPNPANTAEHFTGWYHDYVHFSRGGNLYKRETIAGTEDCRESRIQVPVLHRTDTEEVEAIVYIFACGLYTVEQFRSNGWKLPKNYWRKLGVEIRVYDLDDKGHRYDSEGRVKANARPKISQQYVARYMYEI